MIKETTLKLLRNVFPKSKPTLAIAKRNFRGKIITDIEEIKDLLEKEYCQRLRRTPVRPDLGDLKSRKKGIFKLQLKIEN